MDKTEIIKRLKNIAKHAVHTIGEEPFIMSLDDGIAVHEAIELLEQQEPLTSCEQAIDYLHKTGWLQNHDRILTENKIMPPVELKRGYWIESHEHIYIGNEVKEWINWYCSECDAPNDKPTDFCPNCGTDMRDEQE